MIARALIEGHANDRNIKRNGRKMAKAFEQMGRAIKTRDMERKAEAYMRRIEAFETDAAFRRLESSMQNGSTSARQFWTSAQVIINGIEHAINFSLGAR